MSRRASTTRELHQFIDVVKEVLIRRLEAVNLKLMDIGLREYTPEVITPGIDQYIIVGWVRRDATGMVSTFTTRVGGQFHHTSPEDVEPLAKSLVDKLMPAFYPERDN